MNKVVFITFIAVCSVAFVEGNIIKNAIDDTIYAAIKVLLDNDYPNEPKKTQCMVDDFRRNKVADKFYTTELLTNQPKLRQELQPYVDSANISCTLIEFFASPFGICVLVALFLLAISIICCLIRCICC